MFIDSIFQKFEKFNILNQIQKIVFDDFINGFIYKILILKMIMKSLNNFNV